MWSTTSESSTSFSRRNGSCRKLTKYRIEDWVFNKATILIFIFAKFQIHIQILVFCLIISTFLVELDFTNKWQLKTYFIAKECVFYLYEVCYLNIKKVVSVGQLFFPSLHANRS
jgi:hypothetical protein